MSGQGIMAYRGTGQDWTVQDKVRLAGLGWAGLDWAGPGRAEPGQAWIWAWARAWEGQGTEELTWTGQANLDLPRRASKTRTTPGGVIKAKVACDEVQQARS